jgi:hypothetical protein
MQQTWERRETDITLWQKILNERDHQKGLGTVGRILKEILKKQDGMVLTGFIWLRIGTNGRILCT